MEILFRNSPFYVLGFGLVLLFTSALAQAGTQWVCHIDQDCTQKQITLDHYELSCKPVNRCAYVSVPDAPAPMPQPPQPPVKTSPPPPPPPPPPKKSCGQIAAEDVRDLLMCEGDALQLEKNLNESCRNMPRIIYKDIAVGTNIGSIITVLINGSVKEEYHLQEACYLGATNSVAIKNNSCKTDSANRKLNAIRQGCK